MIKKLLLVILLLNCLSTIKAQSLNWFVSAHAGTGNFKTASANGAVLAGFKNERGQQVAMGPVVKGFMHNGIMENVIGGRLYSQMNLAGPVDVYLQCDLTNGRNQLQSAKAQVPVRLETGMGLNFLIRENIGIGCGYTFGEYNPISQQRKSSPVLKLTYLMPFQSSRNW
ncbi:hypothetical protein [Desertivirga xinjiangensis]|uniref:hypothetical protein n=1 Tax=Desertivirga xinjiangensis TaxID=539206 RepID=UPI00210AB672|nr:hypothetical protein [Pedobacter xinjiangensis]